MIKKTLLNKAVKLLDNQDVNLSLITKDKIIGDVYIHSANDIIPIAIRCGYVISFTISAKPNRFDFEIILDLPF